jgi:hypothetical protein
MTGRRSDNSVHPPGCSAISAASTALELVCAAEEGASNGLVTTLPCAFTNLRLRTTRSTAGAGAIGAALPTGLMDAIELIDETDM